MAKKVRRAALSDTEATPKYWLKRGVLHCRDLMRMTQLSRLKEQVEPCGAPSWCWLPTRCWPRANWNIRTMTSPSKRFSLQG